MASFSHNGYECIFKKSFKEDKTVLLKQFEVSIESFFIIHHEKIVVQLKTRLEIINHVTKETIASFDRKFMHVQSNTKLTDMIYSPDFDSVPKFIFCFDDNNVSA